MSANQEGYTKIVPRGVSPVSVLEEKRERYWGSSGRTDAPTVDGVRPDVKELIRRGEKCCCPCYKERWKCGLLLEGHPETVADTIYVALPILPSARKKNGGKFRQIGKRDC
ncbi:hypothetical protein EVAR_45595_1 [Eumeta japonica]|uniref:Uncharacterized protein n=1 Tax=Eumeta variegata TaxID=151549 RepID=A0A4C1YYF2_EUMVA|nr:hypothetical protein EVAR_45595_1 [Eumeta japonica]